MYVAKQKNEQSISKNWEKKIYYIIPDCGQGYDETSISKNWEKKIYIIVSLIPLINDF